MKRAIICILVFFVSVSLISSGTQKIYWGDSVPDNWNGDWPDKYLTTPEKTNYERTSSAIDILEFINACRWNSEYMHVISMYTSPLGRNCPVVVLANPRVTRPEDALKSGKPVIYVQGNIHPWEAEAKESLLMIMREILFGERTHLLNDLIIMICPNFNVDGNEILNLNQGTPHIIGRNTNAEGLNLNRDAVKVETPEVEGLYRSILNRWDPVLFYDGHAMGRVQHGYAMGYATCTVPAAHPAPRNYVFDQLFPEVRKSVRENFGLEMFTHCGFDRGWPPTEWSHIGGWWSTEAKFVVNAYGLRNRMSILAESPGHESFERKIYAHYAFIMEILEYAADHGKEMQDICRRADQEVVDEVKAEAESGQLKNFLAGKYESYGKVDVLAYKEPNFKDYVPGTSVRAKIAPHMLEAPQLVKGLEFLAKPVGTDEAPMPRGYLIPADMEFLAEKLRTHNVKVAVLEEPITVTGEEFIIEEVGTLPPSRMMGPMVKLEGEFKKSPGKTFPAGSFHVDMAQPLANLAFYLLEPQSADGFVGWGVLDDYFKSVSTGDAYPAFKYYKIQ